MNLLYPHPRSTHAFRDQFNVARDATPDTRAAVNPAMQWICENNAEKFLYQALSLATKPKPVADAAGRPGMWLCPAPNGLGKHVAVVMGLDTKGHLRCMASNAVVQPAKDTSAAKSLCPKNIEAFNSVRMTTEQTDLIQQAVNAACADQMELVEKVCTVSQQFRTMAAFVVVLTADKPLLFVTSLVIYGPAQTNAALSFTGKVVLP